MSIRWHGGNARGRAFARAWVYALTSLPGLLALPGLFSEKYLQVGFVRPFEFFEGYAFEDSQA